MTRFPSIEHEYLHALSWAAGARWLIQRGRAKELMWKRAVLFLRAEKRGGGQCLVRSSLSAQDALFPSICCTLGPALLAPPRYVANAFALRDIGLLMGGPEMTGTLSGMSKGDVEIFGNEWRAGAYRFGTEAMFHCLDATSRYWAGLEEAERMNLLGFLEDGLHLLKDGEPLYHYVQADMMDEALTEAAPRWAPPPKPDAEAASIPFSRHKRRYR